MTPNNNKYVMLNPICEEIYFKTHSDPELSKAIVSIDSHWETWCGEFIHPIEHDLRRKYDLDQNIFLAYLSTQTMVWDWMAFSLKCGCYNMVARELRTILESVALFIHIENLKLGCSLAEKIDYWNNLEDNNKAHGKAIFKASGMINWEQKYNTYKELCKFTHFGLIRYKSDIELMAVTGQILHFSFSKEKFLHIYDLWTDVANAACDAAALMYEKLNEEPCSFWPGMYRRGN